MKSIIVTLIDDTFKSPEFVSRLRVFKKHLGSLAVLEDRSDPKGIDLTGAVNHIKHGDYVVVDGDGLKDQVEDLQEMLEREVRAGDLNREDLMRFQVWRNIRRGINS